MAEPLQPCVVKLVDELGRGGRLYSDPPAVNDGLISTADEDNIVNFDTRRVGDIRR